MMETNQINELYNDLWNFHLVLFGIALSIFTLLYSFILSKRDEIRNIAEQVKSGDKNPLHTQKENFAKKYINRLKSINDKIVVIVILSLISFIISWIFQRVILDSYCYLKLYSLYIIGSITICLLLYLIYMFTVIYKYYKDETAI
jgi:VIT1/CCC1 family predicted Fe2+/Mn2+ transporter